MKINQFISLFITVLIPSTSVAVSVEGHNGYTIDYTDAYKAFTNPTVLTPEQIKKMDYVWTDGSTDADGNLVYQTANIADKAEHPAQIMALLSYIYTNKDIPGTIWFNPRPMVDNTYWSAVEAKNLKEIAVPKTNYYLYAPAFFDAYPYYLESNGQYGKKTEKRIFVSTQARQDEYEGKFTYLPEYSSTSYQYDWGREKYILDAWATNDCTPSKHGLTALLVRVRPKFDVKNIIDTAQIHAYTAYSNVKLDGQTISTLYSLKYHLKEEYRTDGIQMTLGSGVSDAAKTMTVKTGQLYVFFPRYTVYSNNQYDPESNTYKENTYQSRSSYNTTITAPYEPYLDTDNVVKFRTASVVSEENTDGHPEYTYTTETVGTKTYYRPTVTKYRVWYISGKNYYYADVDMSKLLPDFSTSIPNRKLATYAAERKYYGPYKDTYGTPGEADYKGDVYVQIAEGIESVELITNYVRINDEVKDGTYATGCLLKEGVTSVGTAESLDHSYNPGYIVNIHESDLSRCFVMSKGSPSRYGYALPFLDMFEVYAPNASRTLNTYSTIVTQRKSYPVWHDCPDIFGYIHDFWFTDASYNVKSAELNFSMFIPDYRHELFCMGYDGNPSNPASNETYIRYNPHHRPYIFAYGVEQSVPSAAPKQGGDGKTYTITLTWNPTYTEDSETSSIANNYYVCLATEDGTVLNGGKAIQVTPAEGDVLFNADTEGVNPSLGSRSTTVTATWDVPQEYDAKTYTFIIYAEPINVADITNRTLSVSNFNHVKSNVQSVVVPGYSKHEQMKLSISGTGASTWNWDDDRNSYTNTLLLSNKSGTDGSYPMRQEHLGGGELNMYLLRSDSKVPVATVQIGAHDAANMSYPFTVVYGESQTENGGVPDGATASGEMTYSTDKIMNFSIKFIDKFQSDLFPDHADSYTYKLQYESKVDIDGETEGDQTTAYSNEITIPVYKSDLSMSFKTYTGSEILTDHDHHLDVSTYPEVTFRINTAARVKTHDLLRKGSVVATVKTSDTTTDTWTVYTMEGNDQGQLVETYYKSVTSADADDDGVLQVTVPVYGESNEGDLLAVRITTDNESTYGTEKVKSQKTPSLELSLDRVYIGQEEHSYTINATLNSTMALVSGDHYGLWRKITGSGIPTKYSDFDMVYHFGSASSAMAIAAEDAAGDETGDETGTSSVTSVTHNDGFSIDGEEGHDFQADYIARTYHKTGEDEYMIAEATGYVVRDITTGIHAPAADTVRVYPSPAESSLTIEGTGRIAIYNICGVPVLMVDDSLDSRTVEVGNLPGGVYIVRCGSATTRFIKL